MATGSETGLTHTLTMVAPRGVVVLETTGRAALKILVDSRSA